eukprot:4810828-Pyramimonas_sp.AAC.1
MLSALLQYVWGREAYTLQDNMARQDTGFLIARCTQQRAALNHLCWEDRAINTGSLEVAMMRMFA